MYCWNTVVWKTGMSVSPLQLKVEPKPINNNLTLLSLSWQNKNVSVVKMATSMNIFVHVLYCLGWGGEGKGSLFFMPPSRWSLSSTLAQAGIPTPNHFVSASVHAKQILPCSSSSITQHLSINKLHFGMNKRFKMDFCHPPSPKLNGCEHMQRLCCSFLGLYDGTFNCNKSAIDGKWVTDWTGSTADAQGHSTRSTHYFKLPPMRRIYRICQDGALSLTPHLSVSSQRPSLFPLRIAFPN